MIEKYTRYGIYFGENDQLLAEVISRGAKIELRIEKAYIDGFSYEELDSVSCDLIRIVSEIKTQWGKK